MLKKIVLLFQLQTSESFTVYVINVNVPRVRANADKCLQHHQGCQETPKSADVICERPLNCNVWLCFYKYRFYDTFTYTECVTPWVCLDTFWILLMFYTSTSFDILCQTNINLEICM